MAILDSAGSNINIDGNVTSFTDFGGVDTYTILASLSADVTIADNNISRINLPGGLDVSAVSFLSDGVQFTVNGNTVTLLGNPAAFSFIFGGTPLDANAGTALDYQATATAFGTSVPSPGSGPNNASNVGPVNANGSVGNGTGGGLPVLPTINISPFGGQFLEGDTLNTQVTFTISLSEPSSNQVSVDYQTLSFAALSEDVALELYGSTAEADFIGANGTMIFAPGVTQQTFSIEILGDTIDENNENFAVALDNPQGAVLNQSIIADFGTVSYTIIDDDEPPLFFLTAAERASANLLSFQVYVPPSPNTIVTWDYEAFYSTAADFASLDDIFYFYAFEGATYDIFSGSFFDPFVLQLYDQNGNLLELDGGAGSYGTDWIQDYVATYSGLHYVDASWHQGSAQVNKYAYVAVYEDMDTIGFSKVTALDEFG